MALTRSFDTVLSAVGATICISILAWAVSNSETAMLDSTGIVLYYLIPGGLAVGFCASLALSQTIRILYILLVSAVAGGLYMTELYLVQYKPIENSVTIAAKLAGRPVDPRSRLEVVEQMRQLEPQTFPLMTQLGFMWSARKAEISGGNWPLTIKGRQVGAIGTVALANIVQCNESGSYVMYKSDRFGFNNPDYVWDMKQIDSIMVGDSFGLGNCVPLQQQIANQLRGKGVGTINLSGAPAGPLSYLAALQEYAVMMQPETVIWLYYENDLVDLAEEKKFNAYMERTITNQPVGLIQHQTAIDKSIRELVEKEILEFRMTETTEKPRKKNKSSIMDFLLLRTIRNELQLYFRKPGHDFQLFKRTLSQANMLIKSWGGRLLFVSLPNSARYLQAPFWFRNDTWVRNRVLNIVKSLGVDSLDIDPVFARHPNPHELMYFPGSHYSGKGYEIVAESILKAVSPNSTNLKSNRERKHDQ